MALGPFYQGQTPGEPALVTITSPDGSPRDLTDYTASGKLYSPDGTDVSANSFTQINSAELGLVQFDFPSPSGFDTPGVYTLQFELTTSNPDILDFTTTLEMDVLAALPTPADDLIIDSEYVFARTNTAVGPEDILRAQYEIGAFLGIDLAAAWETMTETSQYWVGLATAHQSTWTSTSSNSTIGAKKVRAGSVEVTYGDSGTSAESVMLHPMTRICLMRVTSNAFYATPFIGNPERTPLRPLWVAL